MKTARLVIEGENMKTKTMETNNLTNPSERKNYLNLIIKIKIL